MNDNLSTELAQAHITELRRQACRSRWVGTTRQARRTRRSLRWHR